MDPVQGESNTIEFEGLRPSHDHESRENGTTTFEPQNPTQRAFAQELIAYWTSFARSGSPNTFKLKSAPEWHNYSPSSPTRMVLQATNTTVERGSFAEKEASEDTRRCRIMAGRVATMQD